MRTTKTPVPVTARSATFTFTEKAIAGFPEVVPFLEHLLDRGVSPSVAASYVKLAARLKRQGRITAPEKLTHNVEATAANAYWRWAAESFAKRVEPVITAIPQVNMRVALPRLRVGSLVGPIPGKVVPRMTAMPQVHLNPETRQATSTAAAFAWTPCTNWTLHVPPAPCEPHVDPCPTCAVVDLTEAQVAIIASAFEQAWGHRNINMVPFAYPLFGEAPRSYDGRPSVKPIGRIIALCEPGAVADALRGLGAHVAGEVPAFLALAREGCDGFYVSKSAGGDYTKIWELLSSSAGVP